MATSTSTQATEQDLLAQPRDGRKYELVDGAIVGSPGGGQHSAVTIRLAARLLAHVASGAGHVFESSMGFRLPGGNVRSPDVSFVAPGRFPAEAVPAEFADLAPDLAVEVVSPRDRARQVLDKVGEYLDAGVRLVWVIEPRTARATVYRSLAEVQEMGPDGVLDGEEVVPGFGCPLRDVL